MIFNQLLNEKFNEGLTKMKPSFYIFINRSDSVNDAVQSL